MMLVRAAALAVALAAAVGSLAVGCSSSDDDTATATATGSGGATTVSTAATGPEDQFATARQKCIDKINTLRATEGLVPYERWSDTDASGLTTDTCLDKQATSDEMSMMFHNSWVTNEFPSCNGNGQNECEGYGPEGIESCLQDMWDEKDLPGCAGCDACMDSFTSDCPNCDFFGTVTGKECGHYVNMSAKYLSKAACGFSTASDHDWAVINFTQ